MRLKLTREEAKRIRHGDHAALIRTEKPDVDEGDKFILGWVGGGRQFIGRDERERRDTKGKFLEVPRQPVIWITIRQEPIRRISETGETEWRVPFEVTDEREPRLTLAAAPNPSRSSGLRTRLRPRDRVPTRQQERERMESHSSPLTERGYGGGGKSTVDEREGVEPKTLEEYAKAAAEENESRRDRCRTVGHLAAEEMRLARLNHRPIPTKPEAVSAVKRRIERAQKRLRRAA